MAEGIELDLYGREGALQILVLVLLAGDLIGVGGVVLGRGLLIRRDAVIPMLEPLGLYDMAQGDRLLLAPAVRRMRTRPSHFQNQEDDRDRIGAKRGGAAAGARSDFL